VKKVLAISSAKGGVGKSTVAANLSLALARRGFRTGLLDTDLHGPSIPTLFDLTSSGPPRLSDADRLLPLTNYGVRTMSMGYLVGADQPVAWRGLLIQRALQQLLHEVDWGGLDILLLDLPPGTGDVPLTIAQQVIMHGAVIVSTPSKLARADVSRGTQLWRKMDVPVLGVVRNMARFRCPCCGEETEVFGRSKPEEVSEVDGVPVLADIPLDGAICETGDAGKPSVVGDPEGEGAQVFGRLAETIAAKMEL
jgi:ATP-binding protein involved in chromosome partitioning